VTKRSFDLLLGIAGLIALSPLLVAIAILVRLDSPGPVLFRQERVGRFGRPFTMLKFRTMRHVSDADERLLTSHRDSRITPAGRVLRRAKLDELPQLVNVVRGEMSLVGPRPEVARYIAAYPPAVRMRVLSVRPGITDYAALAYRDESSLLTGPDPERTYLEEILPRKLDLYERYVAEQSVATDLRILLLTVRELFAKDRRKEGRPGPRHPSR
jgi:lipopolysaccharide/colanic/teichoic acid biosynthesis glycosyltransferase